MKKLKTYSRKNSKQELSQGLLVNKHQQRGNKTRSMARSFTEH